MLSFKHGVTICWVKHILTDSKSKNSNVLCMYTLNKIRYAERSGPVHPYRPWADTAKNADAHYRAYKACQNVLEWTVYSLPLLWLYVLYTPAIPRIGRALSWFGAVLGLALALSLIHI